MNYCFTGPAVVNGIHFEREHLIRLAIEKGHNVHKHVRADTDLLVVGNHQTNTVKYKRMCKLNGPERCIPPERFLKHMEFL